MVDQLKFDPSETYGDYRIISDPFINNNLAKAWGSLLESKSDSSVLALVDVPDKYKQNIAIRLEYKKRDPYTSIARPFWVLIWLYIPKPENT